MNRRSTLFAGVGLAAAAAGAGLAWWRLHPGTVDDEAAAALWSLSFTRPEGGELQMASLRGKPRLLAVPGANLEKVQSLLDDGVLQSAACDSRTDVTSEAKNACASLCPDDKYVPNDGHRFISKVDGVTNVPKAEELDPMTGKMVDRGPINAFQCMALVGDGGIERRRFLLHLRHPRGDAGLGIPEARRDQFGMFAERVLLP